MTFSIPVQCFITIVEVTSHELVTVFKTEMIDYTSLQKWNTIICLSVSSWLSFQHLRQVGVVGKFVEFFGPGVSHLSIADRATIANMCPEYGATIGFFPVDEKSLIYLRQTGWVFFSLALK